MENTQAVTKTEENPYMQISGLLDCLIFPESIEQLRAYLRKKRKEGYEFIEFQKNE
jgi:hypothetical protein